MPITKRFVGEKIGLHTIISSRKGFYTMRCETCKRTKEHGKATVSGMFSRLYRGSKIECSSCTRLRMWRDILGPAALKRQQRYVGKTFGQWVVLESLPRLNGMRTFRLRVRCACRKEKVIGAYTIIDGRSTCCVACGHEKARKYFIGQTFGTWKILGRQRQIHQIQCLVCQRTESVRCSPLKLLERGCNHCNGKKFEVDGEWMNMADLGKRFGRTRERVRQLVAAYGWEEAVQRLRAPKMIFKRSKKLKT